MAIDVPTPDVDVPSVDQVGVVVRDLDDGMDRFGALLGVEEFRVRRFEPPGLESATYRGAETDQRFRIAAAPLGDVDLELIEPVEGENSYTAHLDAHGEGLHHVACFSFDDPPGVVADYEAAGVEVLQSGVYHGSRFWYLDMREAMCGVLFEVVDLGTDGPPPDRTYRP